MSDNTRRLLARELVENGSAVVFADELAELERRAGYGARARARRFRAERDELLRLGRDLIRTVPMTPDYMLCLRAFAQCVYRERQP